MLSKVLDQHGVFPEERKVWETLGFYVPPSKISVENYLPKAEFHAFDVMVHIPYEAGMIIRKGVLKMYLEAPKIQEVTPDELADLEVQRG